MARENVIFMHNGVLLCHKKGHIFICRKMMPLETIILGEMNQMQVKQYMVSLI